MYQQRNVVTVKSMKKAFAEQSFSVIGESICGSSYHAYQYQSEGEEKWLWRNVYWRRRKSRHAALNSLSIWLRRKAKAWAAGSAHGAGGVAGIAKIASVNRNEISL